MRHWAERIMERLFGRLGVTDEHVGPLHVIPEAAQLATGVDTVSSLKRTLAMQPHNCLAWFQLGMVHLQQRELLQAVAAFEKARQYGFDTFELHFYLAEALSGLDRHEEAVEKLYRAQEKQPTSPEPSYRLGLSLHELHRYEEAAAAFKIAISLSPTSVQYHQGLGLALERLGRQDEALRCLKEAVKLERRLDR